MEVGEKLNKTVKGSVRKGEAVEYTADTARGIEIEENVSSSKISETEPGINIFTSLATSLLLILMIATLIIVLAIVMLKGGARGSSGT